MECRELTELALGRMLGETDAKWTAAIDRVRQRAEPPGNVAVDLADPGDGLHH